jgi:tetratricopeptide (TPR) repeat protein
VRGRHHYIEAPEPELYDLVEDPSETTNLVASRPDMKATFEEELQQHDRSLDEPEAVSAETMRRLAALGYVGSAATADDEDLPDPKGQIGALADLRRAAVLMDRREFAEAVPVLRTLLAEQPRIVDAWEYLARALENQGHIGEAMQVYEDALTRFPATPLLSLAASEFFFKFGMLDRAAPLAEVATPVDPAAAESLLSQIALRRGDLAEAERRAELARSHKDSRPGPDLAWADVLISRERFEDALAVLDDVQRRVSPSAAKDPELWRGVSFLRGKTLVRMGRADEAEAAFMQEIERFPHAPQAYTHLALMYGLVGMQREALVVITQLLRNNGSPYATGESIKVLDMIGAKPQADKLVEEARRRFPDDPGLRAVIAAR